MDPFLRCGGMRVADALLPPPGGFNRPQGEPFANHIRENPRARGNPASKDTIMTSISGSMSPADRIQLALQSAVSAGTVKSTDQGALSSALTDIGAAMKSSAQSGSPTDPGTMKDKVNSLIDNEVSDGKLTTDQATELKQVFAQATQKMGGHHHHMHVSSSSSSSDSGTSDGSTSSDPLSLLTGASGTGSTDSTQSAIDGLMTFLQQLGQNVSGNYGANGTANPAASTAASMLFDSIA
jgi:hypothetical protein